MFEIFCETDFYKPEIHLFEKYGQLVQARQGTGDNKGFTIYSVHNRDRIKVNLEARKIIYMEQYYGGGRDVRLEKVNNRWVFGEYGHDIQELIETVIKDDVKKRVGDAFPGAAVNFERTREDEYHLWGQFNRRVVEQIPFHHWITPARVQRTIDMNRGEQVDYKPLLSDYLFTWNYESGLLEIEEKAPALMGFLYGFKSAGKLPQVGQQANLMADLRTWMMDKFDLSKGDWKIILKLTAQQGRWLYRDGRHIGIPVALQMLKDGHKFPKVTAMQGIAKMTDKHHAPLQRMKNRSMVTITEEYTDSYGKTKTRAKPVYDRDKNLKHLLVLSALLAANEARNVKTWLKNEWEQVQDWFAAEGSTIEPDRNQLKPTRTITVKALDGTKVQKQVSAWRWFLQKSEQWHEDAARAKKIDPKDLERKWTSILPAHEDGTYQYVPLCTGEDLVVEGRIMHHCVGNGTYTQGSAQGSEIIWSIRDMEGNRLATFQMNRPSRYGYKIENEPEAGESMAYWPKPNEDGSPKHWTYGQMKGRQNADMDDQLKIPCQQLLDRWNAELKRLWDAEQEVKREAAKAERETKRTELEELRKRLKTAPDRDAASLETYKLRVAANQPATPPTSETATLEARIKALEDELGITARREAKTARDKTPKTPQATETAANTQEEKPTDVAVA